MKKQTVKPKESEHENKFKSPFYVITTSAQSYSNIAGVLAGFAFTAVILAMQTVLPSEDLSKYKNWASIAFLVAFVGCVFSSFIFAMVTGEDSLHARAYAMALLGGTGFSVASNLIFFGLAMLARISLAPEVYEFMKEGILPILVLFSALYVAVSAFDPMITFDKSRDGKIKIGRKEIAELFIPSLLPLVAIWLYHILGPGITTEAAKLFFYPTMYAAFAAIVASTIGSLWIASFAEVKFRFSLFASGMMVFVQSLILGALLLIL